MDTVITSAQNSAVKQLRRLVASSKTRRDSNQNVAEGIHLVRSFFEAEGSAVLLVCAEKARKNHEISTLLQRYRDDIAKTIVLTDALFESIFSVHASVGVAIVFSPSPTKELQVLNRSAVLLDDVQDPGNLGTILRTAAAVGITTIVLSAGCASPWSPKALRAGMGAQFTLMIYERVALSDLIKTATVPVLVTTLSPQSQSLYELNLDGNAAWIFGNEGQGVSDEIEALATTHVHIPQAETSVESLNVAAATAVCLYEQYRQSIE